MERKRKIVENQGGIRKSARIAEQRLSNQHVPFLNDDCLLHIFSFLDLASLARLEMVSRRFRDLVLYTYRSFEEIDWKDLLQSYKTTPASLECLASKIGPYVEDLGCLDHSSENLRTFIPALKYFTNLKDIEIERRNPNFYQGNLQYQHYLTRALHTVKTLSFKQCDLTDWHVRGITSASHLKTLILDDCIVKGTWFGKLRNIKSLSLRDRLPTVSQFRIFCEANRANLLRIVLYWHDLHNPEGDFLTPIFENLSNVQKIIIKFVDETFEIKNLPQVINLPQLKQLRLDGGVKVFEFLKHLENHTKLEILEISNCQDSSQDLQVLTRFPKLRVLIADHTNIDDTLLARMGESKIHESLMTLDIVGTPVTNEGIGQFILKCQNLKCLDISNCRNITDGLFTKITPGLKSRSHQLAMAIKGTRIRMIPLRNKYIYCFKR